MIQLTSFAVLFFCMFILGNADPDEALPPTPSGRRCSAGIRPYLNFDCDYDNKIGSRCDLSCPKYYWLQGVNRTFCTANGYQPSLENTKCIPYRCKIKKSRLKLSCTRKNKAGSVCLLSCPNGHVLQGGNRTKCEVKGFRPSLRNFKCVRVRCTPGLKQGRKFSCSDGFNVGSKCTLRCEGEDHVLEGERRSTCTSSGFQPPVKNTKCVPKSRLT